MTNEEKWANTLEKLHNIEPAPFNPNYDEEKAEKQRLQEKFMHKIRCTLSHIAAKGCTDELLDNIEDLCQVYSCAINNLYNYSIKDGKIKHKTERGQKLADIFNN